jgi:AcrR family transcriptional regulator
VGWTNSTDFTVRQIAAEAGVSLATLYRHFDGKQELIDEVSIMRWRHMCSMVRDAPDGTPATGTILGVLDAYTRMTTTDRRFLKGADIEVARVPVEKLVAEFEPYFASAWVSAQTSGEIRRTADPRDLIELAGSVRDPRRRVPMIAMLAGGVCTDRVDVARFAREAASRAWRSSSVGGY